MARLPYLKREEMPAAGQAAYDRMLEGLSRRYGTERGKAALGGVYALLLNSPELAARVSAVGDYLIADSGIELLVKEITCLAVARHLNCQLEWTLHEPLSRKAGVREEVIQGIKNRNLKGFLPKERVFVDYAQEVLRNNVKDSTNQAIEHLMGREGLVNLTILISFTALICYCMHAFKQELPPDAKPLLPTP